MSTSAPHEVHDAEVLRLEEMALRIRETIIRMLVAAGSGHSAGSLGMADVFTALYFHLLRHDPRRPLWSERDRVVLSNGHICPALYATLAHAGYFPLKEVVTLRALGSRLQGHPHRGSLPGIETTSGPLGSGLGQAVGMALAARLRGERQRIYALLSDGEHDEGNLWESVLSASKYRLSNLTAIIDRNNIQIDGYTEDVMPLEPLRDKYEAFGWQVLEADGHGMRSLIAAVREAGVVYGRPTAIIAHTVPGKGVSFMERDYLWHGKPPTKDEATRALAELRTLRGQITSEHE